MSKTTNSKTLNFDHTKFQVYFRDKFMDYKDANVSAGNTAFLYGMGIFTGLRAHYNEEDKQLYIFRPNLHYKRFSNACKLCHYDNFTKYYSFTKFLNIVKKLLKINNMRGDAYIRATEFTDEMAITPKFHGYKDSLSIFLFPLGDYVPTGGMKCKVSSWTRVEDNALPARAKANGSYVNTALAKAEAMHHGYDEAIVLDRNGHVVEGSAENIFIVRDGVIYTPPVSSNILEGVTRGTVIQIAKDAGFKIVEREIDRTELYFADEVFLCGTGAKVSPVTQIDSYKVGNGKMGKISKKIQKIYFDTVKGRVNKYKDWLVAVY